jgi:tetratricopeptide (TPR) repeat protein
MNLAPALLFCILLQQAPPALPGDAAALELRLDALRKTKDWDAIAATCEAMAPEQRKAHLFTWAEALEKGARWKRLLQICEEPAYLDAKGRSDLPAHFKGRALLELKRLPEALAWQMASARKGEVLVYLEAWNTALALADWKTALECARALGERFPTNGDYLGMQGEALSKLARYKEAEERLFEALHLAPKRAMTWADLSCCYNEEARWQEAYDAAGKAVALNPKLMEGWGNRGRAAMGLKRYQEGRDGYAAALALGPVDPVVAANLKANIAMADRYLAYANGKAKAKP